MKGKIRRRYRDSILGIVQNGSLVDIRNFLKVKSRSLALTKLTDLQFVQEVLLLYFS